MSVIVKQKSKMQNIEQLQESMIAKQAKVDCFPVEFVTREMKRGSICAASTMVRVTGTPAPLFGYNARDFDIGYAEQKAASEGVIEDHNFGACCLMRDSITRIDGTWYAKVSVPKGNQRHVRITKHLVKTDAAGNVETKGGAPVLLRDDDGEYVTTQQIQKEGFLLVELSTLEPDFDHPMSAEYVQVDSDLRKQIGAAVASFKASLSSSKKVSSEKRPAKLVKLSGAQLAAALAAEGV